MTKRQWLVLAPVVVLLGFGLSQSVMATPQIVQTESCANCMTLADNNNNTAPDESDTPDFDDDNYDNSQDFDPNPSQEQPQNPSPDVNSAPPPAVSVQPPTNNVPVQNTMNSGNPN